MFETYTCTQTEIDDGNNNKCGGYALAALIHAKLAHPSGSPNGSEIYDEVISHQNDLSEEMFSPQNSDGARSLPSSLIRTAIDHGFTGIKITVTVNYPYQELVELDQPRIPDGVKISNKGKDKDAETLTKKAGYYLILVNDGNHWIAAANDGSNMHYYDPGTGTPPDEIDFSGIIIRMQ